MIAYLRRIASLVGQESWKRYKRSFLFAAVSALFETVSIAAILPLMAIVLSEQGGQQIGSFHLTPMTGLTGLAMLYVLGLGLRALSIQYTARVNLQEGYAFGARLFRAILLQPLTWHNVNHSSKLRAAVLSEAQDFISFVTIPLGRLLAQICLVISVAAVLVAVRPLETLVFAAALAAAYLGVFFLLRKPLKINAEKQIDCHAARHKLSTEALSAIREVRLSRLEDTFASDFRDASMMLAEVAAKKVLFTDFPKLVLEFILFFSLMAVIVSMASVDGFMVSGGLGELLLFGAAMLKLFPSGHLVFANLTTLKSGQALMDKLEQLSDSFLHDECSGTVPEMCKELRVDDVSYTYPGRATSSVSNISFSAKPGDRIAITGPSGSGKSTVVDLIAGLITPDTGKICVDGKTLQAGQLVSWQKQIRYCPQVPSLFDLGIAENIAVGCEYDDKAIRESVAMTLLENLQDALGPDYLTISIGELGRKLSGGQIQRINLARMLYKTAPVYILDEPTNNLDLKTAQQIMGKVFCEKPNAIFIVVTHEQWLADMCDKVVTLQASS